MLLERGTNPCSADSHHRTPALAAQRGHITTLCLLEHQGAPAVPPHPATHLSDSSLGSPPASSAGCSLAVAVPLVLSLCSCPLGTTGSRGHCCPSPHGMPACTPSRHSSCSWRGQPTATAARRPCSEGEGVWPSPACAWGQRQGAAQQQCRQGLGQRGHPSLTQWGGSCSPLPEPSPVGAGTHWWCPALTLCRCLYKNKHCDPTAAVSLP